MGLLDKLKLYAIAFLASVVGILVVMLRIQGGRLSRARLDLLNARITADQQASDTRLSLLKDKLSKALLEHQKGNGGNT